ncbi:hypothetical protein R1sor_026486 [Riccia sorocarpa]|uniref:Uncharacterized protein n=1 Tax=Riccia sorocarpa TaxID=122646 RepID=A0ABD3GC65_9MARC
MAHSVETCRLEQEERHHPTQISTGPSLCSTTSNSKPLTVMSGFISRVLGAGPRFKKRRCKRVSAAAEAQYEEGEEDNVESKNTATANSVSIRPTEKEAESELRDDLKKGFWKTKSRASRKHRPLYPTSWVGSRRPRFAVSTLRVRIVQLVRLMKATTLLRTLGNFCRRLVHAAGVPKAVLSLTDLYHVVADLILRAGESEEDEIRPAGTNSITILRPVLLHSVGTGDLAFSTLRNRPDIQALRETLNLQALISAALIRNKSQVS